MSKVCIFDHPLIQHKLSVLRDKNTSSKEFRELISEIAMLMCFEATRDLPLEEVTVETPVAVAKCHRLAGKKLAIVPILRAGLGMVDGMVSLIPNAKVGHIGLFRDPETHEPVKYYYKMPAAISSHRMNIQRKVICFAIPDYPQHCRCTNLLPVAELQLTIVGHGYNQLHRLPRLHQWLH